MKTAFRKSFARDLKRIKHHSVLDRIRAAIEQVEAAGSLPDIGDSKKIGGSEDCYRIRVGDYRIGIVLDEDTVESVRVLHRRDIYRYFP